MSMNWLKRVLSHRKAATAGGLEVMAEDQAALEVLLNEFQSRIDEFPHWQYYNPDLANLPASTYFQTDDRARQAQFVHHIALSLIEAFREANAFRQKKQNNPNIHLEAGWPKVWGTCRVLSTLLQRLMQRHLPLSEDTLFALLDWLTGEPPQYFIPSLYPLASFVTALEDHVKNGGNLDALTSRLGALKELLTPRAASDNQLRRLTDRIDDLLGIRPKLPLVSGEAWADAAIEDFYQLDEPARSAWTNLLWHCKSASGSKPSVKWSKEAGRLLREIEPGSFCALVGKWFVLADKKRTEHALSDQEWRTRCAHGVFGEHHMQFYYALSEADRQKGLLKPIHSTFYASSDPWNYLRHFAEHPEVREAFHGQPPALQVPEVPPAYDAVEEYLIIQPHMDLLCGLAWMSSQLKSRELTRSLGTLAVSAFRKVPGIGPRAIRVGNACIYALGQIGDEDALGQLALLKIKVKFGGAQAAISKALNQLAERLGISPGDLEEMSVPGYGMTDPGLLAQSIGDFTAELRAVNSRQTELVWKRADGKPQKSVPATVKAAHAEELKELLGAKKDIEKMLPAQAERLDHLYLQRKQWPVALWRERYLDHPLVGALARRLIWNFINGDTTTPCIWLKNQIVDRLGQPVHLDAESTQVALWHPLDQAVDVVLGWRGFLEEWEIVQPFKQAHREVYVLTPAEETTRVYSNRFSAHLLRQHQFNALCAARGWKNKLRLMVDDEYPPATRHLPAWGLRAEYWIEGAGSEYGTDTLDSGAYRYLTTDQVRFYRQDASQVTAHAGGGGYGAGWRQAEAPVPLPLSEIPPLAFSEIMRDVDLFVGVASVGNDPNWLDGGTNERHRGYWHDYGFGELNASAVTRRALLEKLVPKLKIANSCSFEDRFLIVQGVKHRYKIHLGSGNILIAPQDKYLCIVPAQAQVDRAGEKIFLPFEGDRTLSVILSKAFLLAEDDKIKDATILRQLC